jgi:hypothetical protein
MPGKLIIVKAAFDPEARVWFVEAAAIFMDSTPRPQA